MKTNFFFVSANILSFIKLPFALKTFVLSYLWVAISDRFYCIYVLSVLVGCNPPVVGSVQKLRPVSTLTHLNQMEFPTVINWTSPFPF